MMLYSSKVKLILVIFNGVLIFFIIASPSIQIMKERGIVAVIMILFLNTLVINKIEFKKQFFVFRFPFRFFCRNLEFDYSRIKVFEIKRRVGAYSIPKVYIRLDIKTRIIFGILNNHFEFDKIADLMPLIEHLCSIKVPIRLNYFIQFEEEYDELMDFIAKNNGLIDERSEVSDW